MNGISGSKEVLEERIPKSQEVLEINMEKLWKDIDRKFEGMLSEVVSNGGVVVMVFDRNGEGDMHLLLGTESLSEVRESVFLSLREGDSVYVFYVKEFMEDENLKRLKNGEMVSGKLYVKPLQGKAGLTAFDEEWKDIEKFLSVMSEVLAKEEET